MAGQKQLDQLDKAHDAAWEMLVMGVDQSMDSYDASIREAETEYGQFD